MGQRQRASLSTAAPPLSTRKAVRPSSGNGKKRTAMYGATRLTSTAAMDAMSSVNQAGLGRLRGCRTQGMKNIAPSKQ
jgi:hypothetical protein